MSIAIPESADALTGSIPLVCGAPDRVIATRAGVPIRQDQFLAHVTALAKRLPSASAGVNLCEDRYAFLVSFCALAVAGQTNLLPPSRAPQCVLEVMNAHPGSYAISDQDLADPPPRFWRMPTPENIGIGDGCIPELPTNQVIAIGYTSGSTGVPKANPKTWSSLTRSTGLNARLLTQFSTSSHLGIVATVPPQHMYGLETSVLLPLRSDCAIHGARPFLPADVADALREIAEPRLLVTTPVHLRALVQSAISMPALNAIVCATAPLAAELARCAEDRFGAPVLEIFGSTETCIIASRRTAHDEAWQAYSEVVLRPQPDGTLVDAPWFDAPVVLQDLVELLPLSQFRLCGRHADLLEIAGKRASLGDLTRRLLAIDGVTDGVVFPTGTDAAGVRRLAALAVAPNLSTAQILHALRQSIDPVFLPRPLRKVDALPRNETGKLPHAALLAALHPPSCHASRPRDRRDTRS